MMTTPETPTVGGQAVVEGVMMRSPSATSVAVRRPDGSIILRVRHSLHLSKRFPVLGKPGFRGMIVLMETMMDGISALNFSAVNAGLESDSEDKSDDKPSAAMTTSAIIGTLAVSMAFGFALFAALPHFLTWGIGVLTGSDALSGGKAALFHLVDGAIKLAIFLLYVWLISFIKDMRRVFEYHGAEHQAIHTFEAGIDLTPAAMEKFTTLHARCGTAFLVTVIAVSIFVFAGVFPLLPELSSVRILNQLLYVLIKLPLILPIGAISYEIIKLAGKFSGSLFGRIVSGPGLLMQNITTRRPSPDQQEIAIVAFQAAMYPDRLGVGVDEPEKVIEFAGYDDFRRNSGVFPPAIDDVAGTED